MKGGGVLGVLWAAVPAVDCSAHSVCVCVCVCVRACVCVCVCECVCV